MKKILIVSFDLIRSHDPRPSYSIASILANARAHELCRSGKVEVLHEEINLLEDREISAGRAAERIAARNDLQTLHLIAISVYVWCEGLVKGLMEDLRRRGFQGKFVLGGYQITAEDGEALPEMYPDAQHFVKGYAEAALMRLAGSDDCPKVIEERPAAANLVSPFLTGLIDVAPGKPIEMLRWETKRGCPHRCGFCEWGKANAGRVDEFPMSRVEAELDLFRKASIGKINVLDPTFNAGHSYLEAARLMAGVKSEFSLQARFETLETAAGQEFLEICASSGNLYLEFGLQTVLPHEMAAIGRRNDLESVQRVMNTLNRKGIPYEISLIYGIPGQTVSSFMESVNFVIRNGCTDIKCFPLRIPRNSDMERLSRLQCVAQEDPGENFSISQVVSSFSFDKGDWRDMKSLSDLLHAKKSGVFLIQERRGLSWRIKRIMPDLEIGAEADGSDFARRTPSTAPQGEHGGIDSAGLFCRIEGEIRRISLRHAKDDCLVWVLE